MLSAILDSGATGTFISPSDCHKLLNITPTPSGPSVLAANGSAMPSSATGTLPLAPQLSTKAQEAIVLDNLQTGTLILLDQLCDNNCIALFTKYDVKIVKHNQVIITGT